MRTREGPVELSSAPATGFAVRRASHDRVFQIIVCRETKNNVIIIRFYLQYFIPFAHSRTCYEWWKFTAVFSKEKVVICFIFLSEQNCVKKLDNML